MPSSNPALRLEDIVENAERIAQYIEGLDETAFQKDRKTIDAVERCIERVIEATTKARPLGVRLSRPGSVAQFTRQS